MKASTRFKLIIFMIVLAVGGFSYYAYPRKIFPFTEDNLAKLGIKPKEEEEEVSGGLPIPGLPEGTDLGDVTLPPGGTQAVPIDQAGGLKEYKPKPDETINQVFQRELYKQMFLPYDQHPYLYDEAYRSANAVGYNSLVPGNNPNQTVFGFRPPLKGGDVPPSENIPFDTYYDQIYSQYNYLAAPPFAYQNRTDDQYFYPYEGFGNQNSSTVNTALLISQLKGLDWTDAQITQYLQGLQNTETQETYWNHLRELLNNASMAKAFVSLTNNDAKKQAKRESHAKAQQIRALRQARHTKIPKYTPPGVLWQKGFIPDISRS